MQWFLTIKNTISEFTFSSDRTINSIKTAIACFIALCLVNIPGSPLNQWTIISVVVVMSAQVSIGSILKKSYDRIIGTLLGAAIAGISVWIFKSHVLILDTILILSCLIFAYVASGPGDRAQVASLGSAAAIMILLARPPSLKIVFLRPTDIIIGILIALLVTTFVFPIRATVRLKMSLGEGLEQLIDLFSLEDSVNNAETAEQIKKIEEGLLGVFVKQRKLMKDSEQEHHNKIKKSTLYELIKHERQLHRAILLSTYALQKDVYVATLIHDLPIYQKLKQDIIHFLGTLAQILKDQQLKTIPAIPSINFEALLTTLRGLSTAEQSFENRLYIDAFIVSMQFFIDELVILSQKIQGMYV